MSSPLASAYDWLALRIRNKILFSVLAVFVIIYGATLSFVYNRIKVDLLQSAKQEAASTTKMLAVTLYRSYEIDNDSREIQGYIVRAPEIYQNLLEINVLDRKLEIISSTNEDKLSETAMGQIYTDALGNTTSAELRTGVSRPYVHIVYPVSAGPTGEQHVRGAVELKSGLQAQFEYLARFRRNTIGAGVAILIGIALVITLISHSITRPIQALYAGMGKANDGDLDVAVPVVGRDEIGYLTSTFNDMIGSIRTSRERILAMVESSRRFVPDQFLGALGKGDITDVALGDAILRDMTVLFMDIRSFTDLSERMSADENLIFLNSLLESILPAIETHDGFVDKHMGDAVMALFPDRPDDALLAAIDLRARLKAYNREREEHGVAAVDVGVGINSGELILGTLGSPRRIDTTVIGSTVNIASRLESLTKEYGIPILLPEAVFRSMDSTTRDGLTTIDVGPVKVRGIEKEMRLTGVVA